MKRFYVQHDGKQKRKVVVLSKKRERQQQSNYIPFTELETLFCNAKIVPDWLVLSQANPWLFYSELKMTAQQSSTAWGPFLTTVCPLLTKNSVSMVPIPSVSDANM